MFWIGGWYLLDGLQLKFPFRIALPLRSFNPSSPEPFRRLLLISSKKESISSTLRRITRRKTSNQKKFSASPSRS